MMSFSSKKPINPTSVDTLVGSEASIEGNIQSQNSIRIDGKLTGDINSKSSVTIGEKAYVKGNIFAENVSVYGTLEGDVKSSGLLEIGAGGKIFGNVNVSSINISDGAIFKGNCCMSLHNAEDSQVITEFPDESQQEIK